MVLAKIMQMSYLVQCCSLSHWKSCEQSTRNMITLQWPTIKSKIIFCQLNVIVFFPCLEHINRVHINWFFLVCLKYYIIPLATETPINLKTGNSSIIKSIIFALSPTLALFIVIHLVIILMFSSFNLWKNYLWHLWL